MLQVYCHDEDKLDTLTYSELLFQGQHPATHTELFEPLILCFKAVDQIELVLEANDKCIHPGTLVQQLPELTQIRSVKLILFYHATISHLCLSVLHHALSILADRTRYELTSKREIRDLADLDYLPTYCDLGEITVRLIHRADGMFLWARLIVSYLSPPALTL
ncbi:hypothetical protein BDR22DRAFT_436412 [Usnea florida]